MCQSKIFCCHTHSNSRANRIREDATKIESVEYSTFGIWNSLTGLTKFQNALLIISLIQNRVKIEHKLVCNQWCIVAALKFSFYLHCTIDKLQMKCSAFFTKIANLQWMRNDRKRKVREKESLFESIFEMLAILQQSDDLPKRMFLNSTWNEISLNAIKRYE